jgi:hypothetical protein
MIPKEIPAFIFFSFIYLVILGFELRAYTLRHSTITKNDKFFGDRLLPTICPQLALNHNPPDLCLLSN